MEKHLIVIGHKYNFYLRLIVIFFCFLHLLTFSVMSGEIVKYFMLIKISRFLFKHYGKKWLEGEEKSFLGSNERFQNSRKISISL